MTHRILITGGAGFLGTRVAHDLVQQLHATDSDAVIVSGDVRPHGPPPGVIAAHCDVTDKASVLQAMRDNAITTVVHLAAIVEPGRNAAAEYAVDVDGTKNVVQSCIETGVRRIVVSSSGAAYGYHADNPAWLTEQHPLRGNPEFTYSHHKRLVEELLAQAREQHPELEQVIFRIGTILGPTVDNQITALWRPRRILRIAGTESPFVFAWVDDVAAAIVRAATGGPTGIYNVAGDGAVTVTEIAQRLGKRTITVSPRLLAIVLRVARALRLTPHGPERIGFLQFRPVLDNTTLKNQFGYTPVFTSSDALDEYARTHPDMVRPDAA